MTTIIFIVAPVFILILLGFVAAKLRYLPDNADKVLAAFGFKVAMPALLFGAILGLRPAAVSPFSLWSVYLSALLGVWLVSFFVSWLILGRQLGDAPAIGMTSTFGNTVMLGIPVGLVAFGPEAATPMALLVSVTTPLQWIIATLLQEVTGRRAGGSLLKSLKDIVWDLLRNPIIMSLIAGAAGHAAGLTLDPLTQKVLTMLGQAAVPTALFALGMTVAGFRLSGQAPTLVAIIVLKMALFPLLVWLMVTYFVALPPIWAKSAILFAALPVGASAYLFAVRYNRAVGSVSAAIAISTLIAAFTLTILLAVLNSDVWMEMFRLLPYRPG